MTEEKKLTWFKLMWKNGYIQLFPVSLAMIVLSYFIWETTSFIEVPFTDWEFNSAWMVLLIGAFMAFLLIYKGFIQFWNDYKKGNSR